MASARSRTALIGFSVSLLFTLVLNAGSLAALVQGRLTVASLGAGIGSADEVYYFALIRDVADGNLRMGNVSFAEYRDAPSLAGYALLPQGMLAALTGLPITTIVLIGDMLFPALLTFVCFLLARTFVQGYLVPLLFAIIAMAWWEMGWLRSMNPQITVLLFSLAMLFFLRDPDLKRPWVRGFGLLLLFLTQPLYGALVLTAEGTDALLAWRRERSLWSVVHRRMPILLCLLSALLLQFWLQSGADMNILLDTYRRRGLIPSHIPTSPGTQVLLLSALVLLLLKSRGSPPAHIRALVIMLFCGVVVLNQSLVHGEDAIFVLYYRIPLAIILSLAALSLVASFLPKRALASTSTVVAIVVVAQMLVSLTTIAIPKSFADSRLFLDSGVTQVLSRIRSTPSIVLAPLEISNLVPVLTPHYALFTQYAHYEYVGDLELAERYLLLQSFFPLSAMYTVEGDPLVFGLYAGNMYARAKTLCRWGLQWDGCSRTLPDFIPHQDVRRFVEEGTIDQKALLKKYGVTTIITDRELSSDVRASCSQPETVERFTMYECAF